MDGGESCLSGSSMTSGMMSMPCSSIRLLVLMIEIVGAVGKTLHLPQAFGLSGFLHECKVTSSGGGTSTGFGVGLSSSIGDSGSIIG